MATAQFSGLWDVSCPASVAYHLMYILFRSYTLEIH